MVLAAKQEVLEDLEAGRVVVDGEHAHADGELVLGPMAAAVGFRLQLHVLDGHLLRLGESNSTWITEGSFLYAGRQAHNKGVSLDPRNPRNGGERRIKPARSKQGRRAAPAPEQRERKEREGCVVR